VNFSPPYIILHDIGYHFILFKTTLTFYKSLFVKSNGLQNKKTD